MLTDVKLLLAGSTGLVGRHVLGLALDEPSISQVVTPVRRASAAHPKVLAPVVDYEHLPYDAPWWHADAVICTLGTTMQTAGSREAFRRVDHDYPLAVARLAKQHGAPTYVLNSAIGADSASRFFYNRVKGEVELNLESIGFTSLTFVRPGVIGGQRDEFRTGERVLVSALTLLGSVLPPRWQVNPALRIAQALLDAALQPVPGVHVITSEHLI